MIIIVPIASADDANVTPNTAPFITIDPIGNHTIGDVFFINGTTNLPVSENLAVFVQPFHSIMMQKGRREPGIVIYKVPIVSGRNTTNYWSVNVTDGYWKPDEYVAEITAINIVPEVSAFQHFTMVPDTTPFITIDPIGNHTVSDVFFVNGTTNLPVGGNLSVVIEDGYEPGGGGPNFYRTIPIQSGENGMNFWSCNITPTLWSPGHRVQGWFTFTAANFPPGNYGVEVTWEYNVTRYQNLTIFPAKSKEPSTPLSTQIPSPTSTISASLNQTTEIPIPPSPAPFSPAVPIMAVAVVGILRAICIKKG
ncbi:MAG: hypothetical protein ABSG49_07240 [Methanoregula sp.]|uniref:hypothetical protein n=1 Tax=Methanoregula sp. TaxID=2052170 RepID=UPI003C1646D7